MSFTSSVEIPRVVTSQTSPLTTPKIVFPNAGQLPNVRCCETGRPIALDPVTGSTICSCQIKAGVPAYLSRVPTLPETVYGTGNGQLFQPNVVMGTDATAAFYQMGLKSAERQTESGVKTGTHTVQSPYYLDHIVAAQTYNAFYSGLDINNARRKNATRETTSALKAWLYEHRKNPYPTKGEKIMLAIITRMTLTQVSTWFANARRRLKKENKLDGRDDDLSDIEIDDVPVKKTSTSSEISSNASISTESESQRRRTPSGGDLSDISDTEDHVNRNLPTTSSYSSLFSPSGIGKQTNHSLGNGPSLATKTVESRLVNVSKYVNSTPSNRSDDVIVQGTSCDKSSSGSRNVVSRPKIWSISEIISSSSSQSCPDTK